jgi:hypothetical protein
VSAEPSIQEQIRKHAVTESAAGTAGKPPVSKATAAKTQPNLQAPEHPLRGVDKAFESILEVKRSWRT